MESEPILPPELERYILELAASSNREMIPTLLRVARRVLAWIEPLLYKVIHFNADSRISQAMRRALQSKPAGFFRDNVRYLLLQDASDWSIDEMEELLNRCTALVGFACAAPHTNPRLLTILGHLHVQQLTLGLGDRLRRDLPVDLWQPMFTYVTHLDLFDSFISESDAISRQLPLFPALTHLNLKAFFTPELSLQILAECPKLRVFLSTWMAISSGGYARLPELARTSGLADPRSVADPRFVVVIVLHLHYWTHLEAGARGGRDLWSLAEDFLARKARGEIEASCYWIDAGVLSEGS
ncbi:hypothetical protein C8J57DRAFT_1281080 [Mycena rebaudengoi]|nr:hypothetical protein C8J57DRAFT_1281080 [Mycena rebaudengoi]